MIIQNSTHKDKRLMATFKNGKTIHFGLKSGSTYTIRTRKNGKII